MCGLCLYSIDHITIPSKTGRGVLRRVSEVFDCWFESGRYVQDFKLWVTLLCLRAISVFACFVDFMYGVWCICVYGM